MSYAGPPESAVTDPVKSQLTQIVIGHDRTGGIYKRTFSVNISNTAAIEWIVEKPSGPAVDQQAHRDAQLSPRSAFGVVRFY